MQVATEFSNSQAPANLGSEKLWLLLDVPILELIEIDENLIRNELHFIDESNHLKRRKEIYEELYPQSKQGISQANAMNKSLGNDVRSDSVPTFVKDTASKTGKSETVIKEKLQIAKNIVPEVQEVIKEKKVTQTDASKIARLEPEQQKKVAEKQKSSLKPQNICYLNPSKKINSTGTKQKKIL